jgi:hypothetical protein
VRLLRFGQLMRNNTHAADTHNETNEPPPTPSHNSALVSE